MGLPVGGPVLGYRTVTVGLPLGTARLTLGYGRVIVGLPLRNVGITVGSPRRYRRVIVAVRLPWGNDGVILLGYLLVTVGLPSGCR